MSKVYYNVKNNILDILKALDLLERMRQNWDYEKMRAEGMEKELDRRNKEQE